MGEWIANHQALVWSGGISLAVFIATIFLVPVFVARLPADYFVRQKRPRAQHSGKRGALAVVWRVVKNVLGAMLILAGLFMFVLPGPGVVTVLIGLALLDFPGKFKLERWFLAKPWVHKPLNWIRTKRGVEPFKLPDASH